MKNIATKHITPYDFIANNTVIRILLKIRDSKEVFSSASAADKELSNYDKEKQDSFKIPESLKFSCKVIESAINDFPVYEFLPSVEAKKTIIYLHGGAFANQPTNRHFNMVDEISKKSNARVIFPIYPKAPHHQFQETYDLIQKIYEAELSKNSHDNIIFMGDSAGAMMCVTLCRYFKSKGLPLPNQLILISLVADSSLTNPDIAKIWRKDPMQGADGLRQFIKSWAGDEDINSSLINPISVDLSILPKTTIICGKNEIFRPDNELFTQKAESAGVDIKLFEYANMFHCFPLFDLICAKQARSLMVKLINND